MMKKIFLTLIVIIFLLGCQTQEGQKEGYDDLPPPPPMPGGQAVYGVGMAGYSSSMPPWAITPRNMDLSPTEAFPGKTLTLRVSEQYIYKDAYYFNQQTKTWENLALFGPDTAGDWIKNSAATSITADERFTQGENYIVVYACQKMANIWSCNNNKWMLTSFNIKEKPQTDAPQHQQSSDMVIQASILPFIFETSKSEEDNFNEVMVMRYDAEYFAPDEKLKVIVHIFEFKTMNDLTKTMSAMFKEIVNNGWKTHNNQNVALYLDVNDVRNAIWTSGNKLIYIETHNPEFASGEIITPYLQKYPSDLKRVN